MISVAVRQVKYENITLSAEEAKQVTVEFLKRRYHMVGKWIDKDGYLCWDDPNHQHGSVATIKGERASADQHLIAEVLAILSK